MAKRAPEIILEGPVSEMTGSGSTIYVFTAARETPAAAVRQLHEAWVTMWARAGRNAATAPQLLILPPDTALTALSDNALKAAGLMRMKACPSRPTAKSSAPAKTPRSRTRTAMSGG